MSVDVVSDATRPPSARDTDTVSVAADAQSALIESAPRGTRTRLDSAARLAWAGRLLAVLWLFGGAIVCLLARTWYPENPALIVPPLLSMIAGLGLLIVRLEELPQRTLDVLLLATTVSTGFTAFSMPEGRPAFALCWLWVLLFAFALLPLRRALLQAGAVVVANGVVFIDSLLAADSTRMTVALIGRWLLFTVTFAAVGVMVHQLRRHLDRRSRLAEAAARLGHHALSVEEPDELLAEALSVAVELLDADYGTALRLMPDGSLRVAAEQGPQPFPVGTIVPLAPHQSYALTVLHSSGPFLSHDLRKDPRIAPPDPYLSRGVISGLGVPVLGSEGPLGVLAVHSKTAHRFTSDDASAAAALANVVAAAWEQAMHREQLSHQAMHDSLTSLPNRALFLDRLEQALARRGGDGSGQLSPAVMLLDVDDFKSVNDTLGHTAGDQLLAEVARRFLAAVRPEDTVARLGGDEFAFLCDAPDEHAAARLARRVQDAVAPPVEVEGARLHVTVSVGVALAHRPQRTEVTGAVLLRDADAALYGAKDRGRGHFRLFDATLQARARTRLQLESELRRGLEQHEFELHYQPIRSVDGQRVLGLEALLRWCHPARGLLHPDEFLQVAEQTGLILPLGRWVLRTACAQAAQWQRQPNAADSSEPLWISVNVSSRQLDDPGFAHAVRNAVEHSAIAPGTLALELSESGVLNAGQAGLATLDELRDAGAFLILDDFGTGYSSLTQLAQLPIGAVKVDRSFVAGIDTNPRNSAIVSSVSALGRQLGVHVIAEGVETPEQLEALQRFGCYAVQGFLFDRPESEPTALHEIDPAHRNTCTSSLIGDSPTPETTRPQAVSSR